MDAFKDGLTTLNAEKMNELLALQPFSLLYEGATVDSKTGSGTTVNDVSLYNFAIRFTATGVTGVTRAELQIAADGTGQDLTLEIRSSDFAVDGSSEGTLLKTIVVPKEFLPTTAAYWSIPIDLSGLTAGNNYWLIVKKIGDLVNFFKLIGEASQDSAHPCYCREGNSGGWMANNAIHFNVYSGASGELKHGIYGGNGYTTVEYNGEVISKVYRYLPPVDGPDGGIRDVITYTWSGEYLTNGVMD